jgi:hypothetical protein
MRTQASHAHPHQVVLLRPVVDVRLSRARADDLAQLQHLLHHGLELAVLVQPVEDGRQQQEADAAHEHEDEDAAEPKVAHVAHGNGRQTRAGHGGDLVEAKGREEGT